MINQPGMSELDIIRLATAADFVWNTRHYNPDYSLWKVLVLRYGADMARDLVLYAEDYSGMLLVLLNLKQQEQSSRNLKNGQEILDRMNEFIDGFGEGLGNDHALVRDLAQATSMLSDRFDAYRITTPLE
jgi:hypothetical protein